MNKHDAPKISAPREPVLSEIETIVFEVINHGFQIRSLFEHSELRSLEYGFSLMLLTQNGFLVKNGLTFKIIKLITEAANELNITEFGRPYHFGFLEIERDLVRLVADRILQSCLDHQE